MNSADIIAFDKAAQGTFTIQNVAICTVIALLIVLIIGYFYFRSIREEIEKGGLD